MSRLLGNAVAVAVDLCPVALTTAVTIERLVDAVQRICGAAQLLTVVDPVAVAVGHARVRLARVGAAVAVAVLLPVGEPMAVAVAHRPERRAAHADFIRVARPVVVIVEAVAAVALARCRAAPLEDVCLVVAARVDALAAAGLPPGGITAGAANRSGRATVDTNAQIASRIHGWVVVAARVAERPLGLV